MSLWLRILDAMSPELYFPAHGSAYTLNGLSTSETARLDDHPHSSACQLGPLGAHAKAVNYACSPVLQSLAHSSACIPGGLPVSGATRFLKTRIKTQSTKAQAIGHQQNPTSQTHQALDIQTQMKYKKMTLNQIL